MKMATTVQEFRERLFNAKQLSRRRSAHDRFFEKLEHVQPPANSSSAGALSLGVLRVVAEMAEAEKAGVIGRFAITGGMAVTYHSEPVYTVDLDVLALIPCEGSLIELGPIYEFFKQRGATTSAEYLVMEGLKFQFIPAATPLELEGLNHAVIVNERGLSFLVIDLEYLIALKLAAGRNKDLLHIQILLDAPRRTIDFSRLEQILKSHELFIKWQQFRSRFAA